MWVRKVCFMVFPNPQLLETKLFTGEACNPILKIITDSPAVTMTDTGATDFLGYVRK